MEQDINTKNSNNIYCANCGAPNSKESNFCVACGSNLKNDIAQLNNQLINTEYTNTPTAKGKTNPALKALAIILAIASFFIPYGFILTIIIAVIAISSEKYKEYGNTIFKTYGVLVITGIVLMVIVFGMCLSMF